MNDPGKPHASAKAGTASRLAIHGGPKVRTQPFAPVGNRYGEAELAQLREALEQGTLFYAQGNKVKTLCERFAALHGVRYATPTSSGTAAIHVGLGALGLEPGEEVITSPITDAGTIIPILYQLGIPVFADLDLDTFNMTADTIAARVTPRTRGIIVVHLMGNPSPMDEIMQLARDRGLWVLEDCAQAHGATYQGRSVGTFGDVGVFSFNEFKHLSCGDGGICITDNEDVARRCRLFADKAYDREAGGTRHPQFLAPNYRMTELQGAVALAQLDRREQIIAGYRRYGKALTQALQDLPGLRLQAETPGGEMVFWHYLVRLQLDRLACTRDEFTQAVQAEGIPCSAGYISEPVYLHEYLRLRRAFGKSRLPWSLNPPETWPAYEPGYCPNAEAILQDVIGLKTSDRLSEQDAQDVAAAIRKVHDYYLKAK